MYSLSRSSDSLAESARFSPSVSRQVWDRRFYFTMAVASALAVFLAFGRQFYLKSYFASPPLDPLVVLHGTVFSIWMLLFVVQTGLIAAERPRIHRWLGYAGGVLALGMIFLGLSVAFHAERLGHHSASPNADIAFVFALGDIITFAIFVGLAFLWRFHRELHQRLMLLAVVAGLFGAVPPRLPYIGGIPARMAVVGFAFLFAGPIYDFISIRRIHPVYLWGCAFALLTGPGTRLFIASTPGWHRFAHWLVGLHD